jgi:hypothetical protein
LDADAEVSDAEARSFRNAVNAAVSPLVMEAVKIGAKAAHDKAVEKAREMLADSEAQAATRLGAMLNAMLTDSLRDLADQWQAELNGVRNELYGQLHEMQQRLEEHTRTSIKEAIAALPSPVVNVSVPELNITVNLPEQAPPVVNVNASPVRHRTERSIVYDASTGRPAKIIETLNPETE